MNQTQLAPDPFSPDQLKRQEYILGLLSMTDEEAELVLEYLNKSEPNLKIAPNYMEPIWAQINQIPISSASITYKKRENNMQN